MHRRAVRDNRPYLKTLSVHHLAVVDAEVVDAVVAVGAEVDRGRAVIPLVEAGILGVQSAQASETPRGDHLAFDGGLAVFAALVVVVGGGAGLGAEEETAGGIDGAEDRGGILVTVDDGELAEVDGALVLDALPAAGVELKEFLKGGLLGEDGEELGGAGGEVVVVSLVVVAELKNLAGTRKEVVDRVEELVYQLDLAFGGAGAGILGEA